MTFSTAQVILILALVFFLYVVVKKPEIGILAMFALIASLLYKQAIPAIPIGSISLLVTDVILFVLLLRIPYKALTDRSFRFLTTPLDVPLLLFIFASFISAGVAILKYGQDFSVIVGTGLQMIIYYLLFFVITNFIREKKQIRFLFGSLLGIATFVSLAMIIQAKVAGSVRLMYGRIESVGQGSWAARILPPGEVVVFIMFISAVCAMAIINKPFFSTVYLYLIPLLGGGMLLTYNRQYWGAIIFSFFVFMVVSTNRGKKRFLSWLAIVFVSVILIVLPLSRLSKTGRVYSDSIMERFSSLLTVKETYVSDRSLGWRKIENQYAWRSIVRHPLLGIGLFTAYRPPLPGMDIGEDGWDSKRFIHNGYLWVLVNMGLLGFLPLMWLYIRFLTRGFSNWRKIMDPMEKSIVIGYAICGVALSLSILFEPRVLQWRGIMVIATMAGMNEAIILRNEKECRENDMFKEVTHE
jgi:O-antigen ligase